MTVIPFPSKPAKTFSVDIGIDITGNEVTVTLSTDTINAYAASVIMEMVPRLVGALNEG